MKDDEKIMMIKLVNDVQLNVICSDFFYEKESNDYRFEDEFGRVHTIIPREQIVYIYEKKTQV